MAQIPPSYPTDHPAGSDTSSAQVAAEMADDLDALLGSLGTWPVVAVGHSMGGQVVNLLAVRHAAAERSDQHRQPRRTAIRTGRSAVDRRHPGEDPRRQNPAGRLTNRPHRAHRTTNEPPWKAATRHDSRAPALPPHPETTPKASPTII